MKKHSLKIAIKAENTLARERIEKARDNTVRLENLIRQEQEKRIS